MMPAVIGVAELVPPKSLVQSIGNVVTCFRRKQNGQKQAMLQCYHCYVLHVYNKNELFYHTALSILVSDVSSCHFG